MVDSDGGGESAALSQRRLADRPPSGFQASSMRIGAHSCL